MVAQEPPIASSQSCQPERSAGAVPTLTSCTASSASSDWYPSYSTADTSTHGAPTMVVQSPVLLPTTVSLLAVVAVMWLVSGPAAAALAWPVRVISCIVPEGTSPSCHTRTGPSRVKVKGLVWSTKSTSAGSTSVSTVAAAVMLPVLLRTIR